jgi:hypothetical protein
MTPLKRDYAKIQNTFYTEKTKDEVWGKIVELFSTNGIGISLIDKSSGLIISNKTDFLNKTTTETPTGELIDKSAYIVREKKDYGMGDIKPLEVNGTWNIRVFEKDGKTGININLNNIYAGITVRVGSQSSTATFDAKSTGNFEKMVFDSISF